MTQTDQLVNLFSHKESIVIDIDGTCDDRGVLLQELRQPVDLNPNVTHQIALVSLETSSYFPNVTSRNNKFYYSTTNSNTVKTITLISGAYEVKQYNDEVKLAIKANSDDEKNITIEVVESTARTRVILENGYKVYFNFERTWRDCLGFRAKNLTTDGTHLSDTIGNIMPTQKIYVGCNLCAGSNGNKNKPNRGNVLYSFPNTKKFGFPLNIVPPVLRRRELLLKTFDSVRLEFFSDDNEPVNFMGSQVTGELIISQV
jgi:hypothetical protein